MYKNKYLKYKKKYLDLKLNMQIGGSCGKYEYKKQKDKKQKEKCVDPFDELLNTENGDLLPPIADEANKIIENNSEYSFQKEELSEHIQSKGQIGFETAKLLFENKDEKVKSLLKNKIIKKLIIDMLPLKDLVNKNILQIENNILKIKDFPLDILLEFISKEDNSKETQTIQKIKNTIVDEVPSIIEYNDGMWKEFEKYLEECDTKKIEQVKNIIIEYADNDIKYNKVESFIELIEYLLIKKYVSFIKAAEAEAEEKEAEAEEAEKKAAEAEEAKEKVAEAEEATARVDADAEKIKKVQAYFTNNTNVVKSKVDNNLKENLFIPFKISTFSSNSSKKKNYNDNILPILSKIIPQDKRGDINSIEEVKEKIKKAVEAAEAAAAKADKAAEAAAADAEKKKIKKQKLILIKIYLEFSKKNDKIFKHIITEKILDSDKKSFFNKYKPYIKGGGLEEQCKVNLSPFIYILNNLMTFDDEELQEVGVPNRDAYIKYMLEKVVSFYIYQECSPLMERAIGNDRWVPKMFQDCRTLLMKVICDAPKLTEGHIKYLFEKQQNILNAQGAKIKIMIESKAIESPTIEHILNIKEIDHLFYKIYDADTIDEDREKKLREGKTLLNMCIDRLYNYRNDAKFHKKSVIGRSPEYLNKVNAFYLEEEEMNLLKEKVKIILKYASKEDISNVLLELSKNYKFKEGDEEYDFYKNVNEGIKLILDERKDVEDPREVT